ncbi:MAG: UDP-N-acetylmuramate:L-alanyl-gamma-D-glutamyl-meso-diaminopimelate ligase [Acidobacteria bacterium]|nr:UDP-N-acetylmuramate:L-alanyl-gamma-D-glutamyl-meso-diaminopimelate ligase [Acidobacteriota bacterium]
MKVHLIGICGTAMATLAAMLKEEGHEVGGSDQHVYPPMSDFLAERGIPCRDGFDAANVTADIDLVVVGNAVSRGNPEVEEVLDRGLRYRSLPETVRETWLWDRRSIVVAGTHGKTTTASLAAWLLTEGGRDPSFLIGGVTGNFGSSCRLGQGSEFVIEGDEYDSAFFDKTAKFLKYLPDIAVVGNLEFDHADIYADFEAIRVAVRRFVALLPRRGLLLVGADSPAALEMGKGAPCRVETFGLAGDADWRAAEVAPGPDGTRLTVVHRGSPVGRVRMPLVGAFNVRNVLAAFAVARAVGLEAPVIIDAIGRFAGVRRRLEVRGRERGVTVYDDFAHHPTAVRETLAGLRAAFPSRRIWALFEPRSATACRRVFQAAFAEAFGDADETLIWRVYRSALPPAERLSEPELAAAIRAGGGRARFLPELPDIVQAVTDEARDGDLVVVMSNGAFGGVHGRLLDALAASSAGGEGAARRTGAVETRPGGP